MRKQKRQTVKKLMQCAAIIAAGVLAIILFMLAIWYRGKNSEPVTDEQVAAQMQQAEPLVIETPEAAAEGSIRVYDYDGCCIYAYYGKIRINNDGKDGKDIDVEAMALCGLPVKKVWEKVREFLAKYTDELPDTDELDGDSTTGNVEEHRTQER